MYDVKQFRPTLYLVILVGLLGFGLASGVFGLVFLAALFVLVHASLLKSGRFRPLPRWIANALTFLAMLYVAYQLSQAGEMPVLMVGQFLVFLQVIKLYEHRGNRDDAQLLVLSLLLMMASGISTFRIEFAMLMGVYLLLSLYCCLLFHLKVETDRALAAISLPQLRLSPNLLRQDRRHLARSMRRLTVIVTGVGGLVAAGVFIYFPRDGSPWLQRNQTNALTGFSERVSFADVARITQSNEIVAHVQVWRNQTPLEGTEPILLRGMTLDTYTGNAESDLEVPARTWIRTPNLARESVRLIPGDSRLLHEPETADVWRQHVQLFPTGTRTLFAIAGIYSLSTDSFLDFDYIFDDQTLSTRRRPREVIEYDVYSSGALTRRPWQRPADDDSDDDEQPRRLHAAYASVIHPRIAEMARQVEVSGADERGPLAQRRRMDAGPQEMDGEIARNIERFLQNNYRYTLDLTGLRDGGDASDPLVDFLDNFKQGHCEYFAGAMTLMCQSLGLQARMVVGFKCDEYSVMARYYIVRQSQAHAWVEVNTPEGWKTYDPTSSIQSLRVIEGSKWLEAAHFLDYLQFQWGNWVIGYDATTQESVLGAINYYVRMGLAHVREGAVGLWHWLSANAYHVSSGLLTIGVLLAVGLGLLAVGWFVIQRWRLRRRAERIGLDALPASERARLARQLGFYDDLLRMLEHQGIVRPSHQTPREFSDSLTFLPARAYRLVQRLTLLFYRIRFGGLTLRAAHHRRIRSAVNGVESVIARV
jgi:transglutaminase-like putative cysteine protease